MVASVKVELLYKGLGFARRKVESYAGEVGVDSFDGALNALTDLLAT